MDSVIYEDEVVREKVYEASFDASKKLTGRQQKRKVFNMMKKEGIPVLNESEYEIHFEEDSDSQRIHFTVTHVYTKKVPYRILRDEVYHGNYILDGLAITPEEQKMKIFDQMRKDGFAIDSSDDYEIVYDGVQDSDTNETQISPYVVYRIQKEQITPEEAERFSQKKDDSVKDLYREMVTLRDKVLSSESADDISHLSDKVMEVTDKVDEVVEKDLKDYGYFEETIQSLTLEIQEKEKKLIELTASYEQSYEAMKKIVEEETYEHVSSDESRQKAEKENSNSLSIRKEIDKTKRELSSLRGKLTKIRNDYELAKAFGLSASEYQELTTNLRKSTIMNAILKEKGLEDILAIPARERSASQRKVLQDAKRKVFEEIASFQTEGDRKSVLESIEALYGLELSEVLLKGRQRVLIVKKSSYENIIENAKSLPEKIIKQKESVVDYEPAEVPKDMAEVFEKRKEAMNRVEIGRGAFVPGREEIRDVVLRDLGIDILSDDSYEVSYEENEDHTSTNYVLYQNSLDTNLSNEPTLEDDTYTSSSFDTPSTVAIPEIVTTTPPVESEKPLSEETIQPELKDIVFPTSVEDNGPVLEEDPIISDYDRSDLMTHFTIYRGDDDKLYARKSAFERFDLVPNGEEIKINGAACYEISPDDVVKLMENENNETSPYVIDYVDYDFEKDYDFSNISMDDVHEKITIYVDQDHKYYVYKPVLDRFHLVPSSEEVTINKIASYEITAGDVVQIEANSLNDTSPYIVEYQDFQREKSFDEEIIHEENERSLKINSLFEHPELLDKITVYHDQDGKYYVYKPVLDRFHLVPISDEVQINGVASHEITAGDVVQIEANSLNDTSPYIVEYQDFQREKSTDEEITRDEDEKISRVQSLLERTDLLDKYSVYHDQDGKYYVYKPVLDRFHLNPLGDEIQINGVTSYEISSGDVVQIEANALNDVSPYIVEHKDFQMKKNDSLRVQELFENPDLMDKYSVYRDQDGKYYVYKPVLDRFHLIPSSEEVQINGVSSYEIQPGDVVQMEANALNDVSPYIVEHKDFQREKSFEEEITHKENERISKVQSLLDNKDLIDKYTVYHDQDGKYYVYKPVLDRFHLVPTSEEVKINGVSSYEIPSGVVVQMEANALNDISPYLIEHKSFQREKTHNEEITHEENEKLSRVTSLLNNRDLLDKYTVYRDQDGKYYVYKPVLDRFHLNPVGEEIKINGVSSYEIQPGDVVQMEANALNDTSPYIIEYKDFQREKKKNLESDMNKMDSSDTKEHLNNNHLPIRDETKLDNNDLSNPVDKIYENDKPVQNRDHKDENDKTLNKPILKEEKDDEVILTFYCDTSDHNQVYATRPDLQRFGINPSSSPVKIQGKDCYPISSDTNQLIQNIARTSKNPRITIRYENVSLKKKQVESVKPHVEQILDKLTNGLDIRANDGKNYTASNIKCFDNFRDELHSGNVAYNIVHVVPATVKATVSFFRKLGSRLFLTGRGREAMKELDSRLDKLSSEELQVLFDEYKGSQLKTDMNHQINPLILNRLRRYGLERVDQLNNQILNHYTSLFTLLGQIRSIEDKLNSRRVGKAEADAYEKKRVELIHEASLHIREILNDRRDANNILSSGVHGIEEDFKAVSTKMNYVGLRFSKTNDFDNELQHQLGNFGKNLNVALANDNDEAIVQNFMGLESCYYKNTDIRGSIVGRRSVGSKYYSPMAQEFDYRDDPFIRDLLMTVAVTSATVSAVNAVRVHQIESRQLLDEQKSNADSVNAMNDKTMDTVHETGRDIASKRDEFSKGMESKVEQDVLTNANTRERAHLDSTNWKFNNAYHAADHAGHEAYNQFYQDVTNQINQVADQYAKGSITQAEALERMAQISNDANSTLHEVVDSSLTILKDYAATHPQFDLKAVEESMEYLVSHPTAIADMNQAMVDVTNMGEGLTSLQAAHMEALTSLPSDMASTIVCAASSLLLASHVAQSMRHKAQRKGEYGDEVTDMMDDYLSTSEEEAKVNRR